MNLGTGRGITVKELVKAFENVWGQEINKQETQPRPGDIEGAYANADLALEFINWKSELDLEDGIRTAIAWGEKRKEILGY